MSYGMLLGGLGVGAIGNIAGGLFGASGTRRAIQEQNRLLQGFLKEERERNTLIQERTDPFVTVGTRALHTLTGTAEPGEALPSFRDTEFFAFRQEELQRQIQRSLAQRGQLFSGAAMEAEARGNVMLSGEETAREQTMLMNLAGMGLGAATQAGALSMQGLQSAGMVTAQAGTNIFQGHVTRGQQLGGIFTGIGNQVGGAMAGLGAGNIQQQQLFDFMRHNPNMFGGMS
jgi:hypothetical protein